MCSRYSTECFCAALHAPHGPREGSVGPAGRRGLQRAYNRSAAPSSPLYTIPDMKSLLKAGWSAHSALLKHKAMFTGPRSLPTAAMCSTMKICRCLRSKTLARAPICRFKRRMCARATRPGSAAGAARSTAGAPRVRSHAACSAQAAQNSERFTVGGMWCTRHHAHVTVCSDWPWEHRHISKCPAGRAFQRRQGDLSST